MMRNFVKLRHSVKRNGRWVTYYQWWLLVKAQAAEPLYFGNSLPEDQEELLVQDEQGNPKTFRASDVKGSRIVEILQSEQWPVSEMAE